MGAQVVSGIGFLGAGTILVTGHAQIKGLTTAAGLWSAAAVGLAIGIGFYEAAIAAGVMVFVILTILNRFDHKMHRYKKMFEAYFELSESISLRQFINEVRMLDIEIDNIQIDRKCETDDGVRSYIATLNAKKRVDHIVLLEEIDSIEGVVYLREL